MNMHTNRANTDTETKLVEIYDRLGASLPGDGAVAAAREDAITAFKEFGLPTRRVEAWHYTDLRVLMREAYEPAAKPDVVDAEKALDSYEWLSGIIRLPIVNGHYFPELAKEVPEAVIVSSLCEGESAFIDGSLEADNAIYILNTAFATDGLSMIVDEGETVDETIGIANVFTGDESAMSSARNNIVVCDGAVCSFSERHVGPAGLAYTATRVTNLWLGVGAKARWVIVQEEGDMATHLGQLNVTLGEKSELEIYMVNTGGKLVRSEINVVVAGEYSSLKIRGVNLVGNDNHVDVTTVLKHNVPNTDSSQVFRNVATDRGNGVFQGQIQVAQIAQKTDAAMACNTLLLSDECGFSAKPELEIFADDVLCAHGATIADLEESHLFYMMARGIPEKDARNLLIKAFLEEILDDMEDEKFAEALICRIDDWLDARK